MNEPRAQTATVVRSFSSISHGNRHGRRLLIIPRLQARAWALSRTHSRSTLTGEHVCFRRFPYLHRRRGAPRRARAHPHRRARRRPRSRDLRCRGENQRERREGPSRPRVRPRRHQGPRGVRRDRIQVQLEEHRGAYADVSASRIPRSPPPRSDSRERENLEASGPPISAIWQTDRAVSEPFRIPVGSTGPAPRTR